MIKYSMEFPVAERRLWLPFCDMEFVLAHKVLQDQDYAKEILNRSKGSPPVILDNSMHELGDPLSVLDIVEAASRCHPDWVIPPDRLGQFYWNLDQLRAMEKWVVNGGWKLASVMCGVSPQERARTVEVSHALGCEMMCFPYREDRLAWVREQFMNLYVSPKSPLRHIHLLGVSSLDELRDWAKMGKMVFLGIDISVDTAKAYKWGLDHKLIDQMTNLRSSPLASSELLNIQTTPDDRLRPIIQNIHTLKAACAGR